MKIAIDIDDTLTNSFDYFMPYVAEFFNVSLEYLKEKNISYSNLPTEWKDRELEFNRRYYDSTVEFTPFKKNAVEIVNKIKDEGNSIYIVTARTKDFYTDPYAITKKELDRNGILYDKLVCTFDKASFCKENNIDLFIDDSINNCQSVKNTGIPTLLFNSPANKDKETNLKRVFNWEEVYNIVNKNDK